jgi:hypothetical protein
MRVGMEPVERARDEAREWARTLDPDAAEDDRVPFFVWEAWERMPRDVQDEVGLEGWLQLCWEELIRPETR